MVRVVGKFQCHKSELNLVCTLTGGQSFRWQRIDNRFTGVFAGRTWTLHQNENFLFYEVHKNFNFTSPCDSCNSGQQEDYNVTKSHKTDSTCECNDSEDTGLLKHYLRLEELNLKDAYSQWSSKDKHFKKVSNTFQGIRILNQDPVENLFSFICSSNNNIIRISSMVQKMCSLFGEKINCVNGKDYYDFPDIASLAAPVVVSQLRQAGFGYRAQYIHKTAEKLINLGGKKWLEDLKNLSYCEAREQLMLLPGVGAKVADCVCLMSLGFMEAVPIDTHIFKVAAQWYLPHLSNYKSVTPRIHHEVSEFFRNLYGPFAGWAHTILFCSSLKMFDAAPKCSSVTSKKRKKICS